MTLFNYNLNPRYPDRYSRDKNWVKVLPVDGRHIQTAELTEMQSIIQDNLKQGFDTLFKSGTPLNGLRVGISQVNGDDATLSVSSGQIYIEGLIIDVEEATLTVPLVGTFTIGIVVEELIHTEVEDPTLRDPIRGGDLYGPEGAARLIWRASIAIINDNPSAYALAQVIDGVPIQKEVNPFYQVERVLSQYTYERSGHFCVSGFEVTSLGTSRRVVSDQTKYSALQQALAESTAEQQAVFTDALTSQTRVNNLTAQLQIAIADSTLSPTPANIARVSDLTARLEAAQAQLNTLSNLLVSKEQAVNTARNSLNKSENLLVDKELFSISPGIAYVEGYRVAKAEPTALVIPKDLPETIVDSARFTYSGTRARTLRQFSTPTDNDIVNSPGQITNIGFTFNNLSNFSKLSTITTPTYKVSFNMAIAEPIVNLASTLGEIVRELNSITTPSLKFTYKLFNSANIEITKDEAGNNLTPDVKRELIKTHIITSFSGDAGLLFSATSLSGTGNTIQVVVDTLNATNILVDVPIANLGGGSNINSFQLGFRPVAQVIKLVADVQEVLKPIIRGATTGTSDKLGDDSIVSITSVIQGNPTTGEQASFVEGIDYRLINQSQIDWSLAGTEPEPGTTYFVSFIYTQPFAINQDFILEDDTDSIKFTGRTPAIGGIFTVDYSYYLAKAGIITLDKDGIFSYVLSPASQEPVTPVIPANLLGILSFTLYADRTSLKPLPCRRQTVEDLYKLSDRVRTNTKNAEILRIDLQAIREALSNEVEEPIGTYNDSIQDLSRIDDKKTTGAIVPAIQAYSAGNVYRDIPLRHISGGQPHFNELELLSFVTLPYQSVPLLAQPRATKWRAITPYDSSIKRRGRLNISYSTVFLNNSEDANLTPCDAFSKVVNSLAVQNSDSPVIKTIVSSVVNLLGATGEKISQSLQDGSAISVSSEEDDSYITQAYKKVTVNNSLQLRVKAEGLVPGSNGYKLYFSGKEITQFSLLASTGYSITPVGSIRAKTDGTIHLSFFVPVDTLCGVHTIELISENGYAKNRVSVYNNLLNQITLTALKTWGGAPLKLDAIEMLPTDYADFLSEDLIRLAIDSSVYPDALSNFTTNEVTVGKIFPTRHKPLSQTFQSPETVYLTKILLKMRAVSSTNNAELDLFIRSASTLPERTTYVKASSQTYNNSVFADEYTEFNLKQPLLLQRKQNYSLCLDSLQQGFQVYTAEIGKRDIQTNNILGNQLYLEGDLYTTKDGISLTQEGREDLTYELQRAEFLSTTGELDLGTYGVDDLFDEVTAFCLNTRDIIPIGTDIQYEYSLCRQANNCGGWQKFKPNSVVCLSSAINSFKVRAILTTNFSQLSPSLQIAGSSMTLFSANYTNEIVSRLVHYPEPYRHIEINIQYVKPASTDIRVYYSPGQGLTWQGPEWLELTLHPTSVTLIDPTLNLYKATYKRSEPTNIYMLNEQRRQFRYRIKTITGDKALQPVVKNIITYVS